MSGMSIFLAWLSGSSRRTASSRRTRSLTRMLLRISNFDLRLSTLNS